MGPSNIGTEFDRFQFDHLNTFKLIACSKNVSSKFEDKIW